MARQLGALDAATFLASFPEDVEADIPAVTAVTAGAQPVSSSPPRSKKRALPPPPQTDEEEDEEALHKQQLDELAEKDPEFHAYLKENASDLLHFGSDDDDDDQQAAADSSDDDDGDAANDNDGDAATNRGNAPARQTHLTVEAVRKLERDVVRKPDDLAALRRLVRAFRAGTQQGALVASPEAFDKLIVVAMRRIATALEALLGGKGDKAPHFGACAKTLKSFLRALAKFMSSSVHPTVARHVLLSSRAYVRYFSISAFAGERKRYYLALIEFWAAPDTDGAARLAAFFRLRQIVAAASKELVEPVVKKCYLRFAKSATSSTQVEARERIGLQSRCIVELCGLDLAAAYTVAFGYIRQLALHLRTAMAAKTPEAMGGICSWPFVHCMRLWGAVLSSHDLADLDYPLIQVAMGVSTMASTARLAPLRVHCLDIVNGLCAKTGAFAPVAPSLVHVLNLAELHAGKTTPGDRDVDIAVLLKFKAGALLTANARAALIDAVVKSLRAHLITVRTSVAFPEAWFPVRRLLTAVHFDAQSLGGSNGSGNVALAGKKPTSKKERKRLRKTAGGESVDRERGAAWRVEAGRKLAALIREADAWAAKAKEAREGRMAGVARATGPADETVCAAVEAALRKHWKEQEPARRPDEPLVERDNDDDDADATEAAGRKKWHVAASAPTTNEQVAGDAGWDDDEEEEGDDGDVVRALDVDDF